MRILEIERERKVDRQREGERERDRQRETDRDRETERQKERKKEKERERERRTPKKIENCNKSQQMYQDFEFKQINVDTLKERNDEGVYYRRMLQKDAPRK